LKKKNSVLEQSPLFEELSEALKPTWHEAQTAGRVQRHTAILQGIAHELSNDPDRPDRPKTAEDAQLRSEGYLNELASLTPRAGLAVPTGEFIDGLIERYGRYREHLFLCFDDGRIPSTTNDLEGFFGGSKQMLRRALGCGSTSNSVVSNLGEEALIAYSQMQNRPGSVTELMRGSFSVEEFLDARAKIAAVEAPSILQRSMVRHLELHLRRLKKVRLIRDP
jgi:hypothetical protein